MKYLISFLFWMLFVIQDSVCDDLPCAKRQAEFGGVCVCNSSYCDTIERPSPLPKGLYYHYITSKENPGFHRSLGSFDNNYSFCNGSIVFTVNSSVKHQEIFGFGGAFSDSTGTVVNSLPIGAQDKLIESYFSKDGIEFSMGRVPIGATDFSPRLYSYDDVPDDVQLKYFNLTEEDFKYKIPIIQRAQSVSPHEIKLLGSIFSSPKWMKNKDTWKVAYIKESYFDAWARYHIKFLDAYADNGIKLWSLTGGNEVMLDLLAGGVLVIGTIAMPHDHIRWMRDHLAPQLAASNHSNIRLLIMDDVRIFTKYWMSRFAVDKKAYQIVDGVAVHWYFDWYISDQQFEEIAETFRKSYPDKLLLYTESSINVIFGDKPVELGSWERGAFYSYSIIKNLNLWTNGYLDWNLALDTEGGPNLNLPTDAAIIVNASSGEFYKNPIFYSLGHFSKFIPPGSKRVDVLTNKKPRTARSDHLSPEMMIKSVLASRHDFPIPQFPQDVICLATVNANNSSTTVIILNTMDSDVNVTILDTVSGNISATITANSINTFVYWPNVQ